MRSWLFRVTVGVAVAVVLGGSQFSTTSHAQASSRVESADDFQGFLEQYCLRCHTDRRQQAGAVPVSLEGADVDDVGAHADLWEEVVRRVRAGLMPPMGSRGPDPHDPTRRGNLAGTRVGPSCGEQSASRPSDDRAPAQPHGV